MSIQLREIVENLPNLLTSVRGSLDESISGLQTPALAESQNLIFVGTPAHLKEAEGCKARAWVVAQNLLEQVPASVPTVLSSPNVTLAMATIAKRFFPLTAHHQPIAGPRIHPSAQIAATARLGENVIVGPGAVIGENCEIGAGAIIGAGCVLEPGVKVGARTHLHPLVFIGHSCELGEECEVHPHTTIGTEGFGYAMDERYQQHRITHYGRVVLEDRVHIGANVSIDRGTFQDSRIGAGTKIDNHCHFGHNIVIGKNSIITAGMITAGSVTIGDYCVFGGRTTISGHLRIASKTQIGGLSGISKSVEEPGEYSGFPLLPLRETLKARVAQRNLPELLQQVKRIVKHLGLESK